MWFHHEIKGMLPLPTDRLAIRPFARTDAPFILRLLNEPSFITNIADKGVRTIEQAEDYLQQGPLENYAAHGHGLWLVEHRGTGLPVGMCGLIRRESLPEVDLGYAFLPVGRMELTPGDEVVMYRIGFA